MPYLYVAMTRGVHHSSKYRPELRTSGTSIAEYIIFNSSRLFVAGYLVIAAVFVSCANRA